MSLEDAINRLAAATENNAAVREIIRQRDEAVKLGDQWKCDANYYKADRDDYRQRCREHQRKASALRGVITRMKKAGK